MWDFLLITWTLHLKISQWTRGKKEQTDKNSADDSDSVPLDPDSGRAAPARLSELLCGLVFWQTVL